MNISGLTSDITSIGIYVILLLIFFLFLGDAILLGIWLRRFNGSHKKRK